MKNGVRFRLQAESDSGIYFNQCRIASGTENNKILTKTGAERPLSTLF